jgi:hypothetical protein
LHVAGCPCIGQRTAGPVGPVSIGWTTSTEVTSSIEASGAPPLLLPEPLLLLVLPEPLPLVLPPDPLPLPELVPLLLPLA